jgi:two-component sensor histidine kinase
MVNPATPADHGSTAPRRSLMTGGRSSRARLAHRELRYRALFEGVSDGFALVEAVRGPDGRLVDYVVLEANPALHRILQKDEPLVGRRQTEILPKAPPGWMQACETAFQGRALRFEYHSIGGRRWFDIHLSRVGPDQVAQLIVDITDRKQAEARQAEMFDELNHRVKNNLAVVSAMLAMQARASPSPEVRDHLAKAVDRIKTIADVHASLYRSGRRDEVEFAAYLNDLCARLGESVLDKARVGLQIHADPAVLPLDKAVALGVVVNELVTNAAKHAYPSPATGIIAVKLVWDGEELKLTVGDDGPGFSAEPPRSGLGMRLVRSLVQQMGAAFTVEHHPGASFTIRIPGAGARPKAQAAQTQLL